MNLSELKAQREALDFLLDVSVLADIQIKVLEMIREFDIDGVVEADPEIQLALDWMNRPRASFEICGDVLYDNITLSEHSSVSVDRVEYCLRGTVVIKDTEVDIIMTAFCGFNDLDRTWQSQDPHTTSPRVPDCVM